MSNTSKSLPASSPPPGMRFSAKLLSAANRWTQWSEGHIFAFTPEQIAIVEGIRASFAIVPMLAAGLWLNMPDLAWSAVAAFWTCLCDPGGPNLGRAKVMTRFSVAGSAIVLVASYCAQFGTIAAGVALFVLVLLAGLARSYRPTLGPMPSQGGLIAGLAAVIAVTSPRDAMGALELAGCFLLGSLWAVLLCVFIWRTHPRAPARRSLVAILVRLDDTVRRLLDLDLEASLGAERWTSFNADHRRAVRISIERGREAVARLSTGRTHFNQVIDAAGRIFAALIALGHHRSALPHPFDPVLERPLLEMLRKILQEAIHQAGRSKPNTETMAKEAKELLRQAEACRSIFAHGLVAAAKAFMGLARQWQLPEPTDPPEVTQASAGWLKIPGPVYRHALRVAVGISITYTIGALLDSRSGPRHPGLCLGHAFPNAPVLSGPDRLGEKSGGHCPM